MPKLRQEINMLNATIAATSVGFVTLTTTEYSGTVTYAFEIVGRVTSGTASITCQRNGTATNDATISLSATSYTRLRVTLTPPAGTTNYRIGISGGTGPQIRAARILVFQNSGTSPISKSETQIEIGGQETQISSANIPLTAPKYWNYDASKWDSELLFFVSVVGKRDTSDMSTTDWVLQEDNGSFGSWVDTVTIASSVSSTGASVYTAQFTPTNGRNYRIASRDSNTLNGGRVTYGAKIHARCPTINQVGGFYDLPGGSLYPAIAGLSSTRVAFFDMIDDLLTTIDFDGTSWVEFGSSLGISSAGTPALAALSSNRVAFIDGNNDSLRVFDFNGTTWSQVGNSLAISTVGAPALAALSSTRVAFVDSTNRQLRVYDFNGTNWSQIGNSLTISAAGTPALAALSSTRVAFFDAVNDSLRVFDFNGTNWLQVGTSFAISNAGTGALAALSSTRVAFIDGNNDSLRVFDFNGTTWSQVGNSLVMPVSTVPAIAAMSPTLLAYVDSATAQLSAYDMNLFLAISKIEPQYQLINQNIAATGLQDFDSLFDPAEWGDVFNSYFHETNADGAGSSVKIQTNPNITPADVSGSTVTGANRQRTAALTMPSTSQTIDAHVVTA